jgi:hypothetical protein
LVYQNRYGAMIMKKNELFLEIIKNTKTSIESYTYRWKVKIGSNSFTRERKLGFENMILFMLNMVKKTLTIELDNFFKDVLESKNRVKKQAYSKARQNISYEAFTTLIEDQIRTIYTATDLKTYRGYRVTAVDGSTTEIENTSELRENFGFAKNATVQLARARVSGLFDIENGIIIDALIDRYDTSERAFALRHIEKLKEYGLQNDLILFDRGYPSKELIAALINDNINFVMRVSKSFLKEVNGVKSNDEIVSFKYKDKRYRMRVVKFMLDSGEEEILVTTLLDKTLSIEDFKELYFKRWGIEVKYDELKHRLQVENFTGKTPISIKQDFYATIFLANMVTLAKMQSDDEIQEKNDEKELKYNYQTNVNILVGKLKDKFILMIIQESDRKRNRMYKEIINEIVQNTVPIRPDRHNIRNFKKLRPRYPMNAKRSI